MGVLDDVRCNNDMFGEHRGETHQTASLNAIFPGSTYEITPSGRLELLECTFEDHSDPDACDPWERFSGAMTPVFTGARRDLNYHGWLDLAPICSVKFTDGTLTAIEPYSVHSRQLTASEAAVQKASGSTTGYLLRFFTKLEKVKPRKICDVSHAISFQDERLCVLLSIGDFRERVYVEDLEEDPLRAAQRVVQLWNAKLHRDEDIE